MSYHTFLSVCGLELASLEAHVFPWGVRLIIKSVVTIQPHGVRLFAPSVIAECLLNTELILPREELALA
jgi:hypothetical protein